MDHRLLHRFQSLCIALVAGLCTPLVSAGPIEAEFKATIYFSEGVVVTNAPPCFMVGTISGRGVATKLGAVTLASTDCINPIPPEFTSIGFTSTLVVLTTVKGDEVWAAYSGILSPAGVITGEFVIHGGTGHYVNATGSGTMSGFEAIDPATLAGNGQIRLEGTLSY